MTSPPRHHRRHPRRTPPDPRRLDRPADRSAHRAVSRSSATRPPGPGRGHPEGQAARHRRRVVRRRRLVACSGSSCWSPPPSSASPVVPGWLAALLVAVVLFAVAGVLALSGRRTSTGRAAAADPDHRQRAGRHPDREERVAVTTGARRPERPRPIKAEIDATREQLARTVDELSARLDVPARAKERAARAKDTAVETYRESPPWRSARPGPGGTGGRSVSCAGSVRPDRGGSVEQGSKARLPADRPDRRHRGGSACPGPSSSRSGSSSPSRTTPRRALQSEYKMREVVLAAAIQGAIFAATKAAIDRAGARGFTKLTGTWPGD